MPTPPDPKIKSWFDDLRTMQADSINPLCKELPFLQFANANIATYLISPAQQKAFLAAVFVDLTYPFSLADIATGKTFRGLLEGNDTHLLEPQIYDALKRLSTAPLSSATTTSEAYYAALATTAFPGGSTGAAWTGALSLLMASMDPTCFTLPFRLKVNALVDKDGSTMDDVIQQIVGLG